MAEVRKVVDELPDLLRTLGETLFSLRGLGFRGETPDLPDASASSALAAQGLSVALEELRAAYYELVESREIAETERSRYEDLFQFAPDAYLVTNMLGRILEANVAAGTLFNVSIPYLVGKPLLVYVHREDLTLLSATLTRMKIQERGECTLRLIPRSRQTPIIMHATIGAVDHGRRPHSSLRWIIHDVTRRVESEMELEARGKQLKELAAELCRVEAIERRRIAAAIHDNVSQNLAIARMKISSLRGGAHLGDADARTLIEVDELLGSAVQETRDLTFDLSPPVLYELGLLAGLEWLAERFHRLYGLKVKITATVKDAPPVDESRLLLFQAVRELLTNAVKHARAKRAEVTISAPDGNWRIVVVDNGIGIQPKPVTAEAVAGKKGRESGSEIGIGFGLFNIRTRLELMGGKLSIESAPRRGTQVTVMAPLSVEHAR